MTGGRLVDPQNSIDAITNVGLAGGKVVYIGEETPHAEHVIEATGKVVAPGFIDLHSHAQNLTGHRLQALDGVTTTLELESGAAPLTSSLTWAQRQGRPLHYGYSAGWLHSRIIVMEELSQDVVEALPPLPLDSWAGLQDRVAWRQPANADQIRRIVELTEAQLDDGAIGIGMLLGYCPRSTVEELDAIAQLGVRRGVPLFVHARAGAATGLTELIELSRSTGVQVHLCHFASTNSSAVEESSALIAQAQAEGLPLSTESYPFGMSATVIGAGFLAPEALQARGFSPSNIIYLATGEEIPSYDRLTEIRAQDPGGLVMIRTYDERDPKQLDTLKQALTLPGAAFASDSMPVKAIGGDPEGLFGDITELTEWPLPAGLTVHPRSSSCFTRAISWLHRDSGALSLDEVISRSSTIPAHVLRGAVPAFHNKGHLAEGADADVVVFDLGALSPTTTFTRVAPSAGIEHVLVGGTAVVAAGALLPDSLPGQPILG